MGTTGSKTTSISATKDEAGNGMDKDESLLPPSSSRPIEKLSLERYNLYNKNLEEFFFIIQVPFSTETTTHANRLKDDLLNNVKDVLLEEKDSEQKTVDRFTFKLESLDVLGTCLAFLMLNRPAVLKVFLHLRKKPRHESETMDGILKPETPQK